MLKLLDMNDIIFNGQYDEYEENKLIPTGMCNKHRGEKLFVAWGGGYDGKYHEAIMKVNNDNSKHIIHFDEYGNQKALKFELISYDEMSVRIFPGILDVCRFIDPATGQTITPIGVETTSTQYILTTCNNMKIAISKTAAVINPLVYDEQDDKEEIPTHIISATDDNTTRTSQTKHTCDTIDLGKQTAFHRDHQPTGNEQALRILATASEIMETCRRYHNDDELGTEPISITTANMLQEIANLTSIYGITQDQLNDAITETKNTNTEQGMFTGKEPTSPEHDDK